MNLKKLLTASLLTITLIGCSNSGLPQADAKTLAEQFINENLVGGDLTAEVLNIEAESGFWKLDIKLSDGREAQSLMSKDGKIFVPEAIYIDEVKAAAAEQAAATETQQTQVLAEMPKNDKPVVELFVMSHCPFGTQAEKAIIPVIEALGDSVDFQLRFVDYAMHGKTEIDEQLQQFVISEKYPEKLISYLKTFLEAGDSEAALADAGLSTGDLADAIAATDAKFEITENLEDKNLWLKDKNGQPTYPQFKINATEAKNYGVRGSPTLVVNGKVIEGAARDSAGILEIICNAFNTPTQTCDTELSATPASSGFGYGEGEGSGGECS
jgi:protein-disulfide isomerase